MNHDATNGMIVIAVLVCGYLLPWIVAAMRGHLNTMAIGVFNLFLGWTFLGWVAALVWACTSNVKPRAQRQPRQASLYGLASASRDRWEKLKAHPKNLTQVGLGE